MTRPHQWQGQRWLCRGGGGGGDSDGCGGVEEAQANGSRASGCHGGSRRRVMVLAANALSTHLTVERTRSISTTTCKRRPGVATTMSGFACMSLNCWSIESPPSTTANRRSVCFPSCRQNLSVCSASSLVGESTSPRMPTLTKAFPGINHQLFSFFSVFIL